MTEVIEVEPFFENDLLSTPTLFEYRDGKLVQTAARRPRVLDLIEKAGLAHGWEAVAVMDSGMTVWLAVGLLGLGLWLAHDGFVRPGVATPRSPDGSAPSGSGIGCSRPGLEGVTLPMLVGTSVAGRAGRRPGVPRAAGLSRRRLAGRPRRRPGLSTLAARLPRRASALACSRPW